MTESKRPYCQHCKGKGWFDGLEIPCRWCNPGGEFRSLGLGTTAPAPPTQTEGEPRFICDADRWRHDLTAAGWKEVSATAWQSPDGGLYRGPAGAWKELQRRTQPEREQSLWSEAATIVEACLNVHSTYSDAEREFAAHLIEVFKTRDQHPDYKHRNTVRAYPAAASADTVAPKCVHCGHDKYWSMTGTCGMNMGARATIPRPCGCKCEFVERATSPRCPKCGYVMCQQFDSQSVNAVAELAIPNGKYICYHCEDAQPVTTTAARACAEEIKRMCWKMAPHIPEDSTDYTPTIDWLTSVITRNCFPAAGVEGDQERE